MMEPGLMSWASLSKRKKGTRQGVGRSRPIRGLRMMLMSLLAAHTVAIQAHSATPLYQNPVLYADYSDPDVIRDGKDYYLIASSFHFVPGIPVLHSRDLVHWEIVSHVVDRRQSLCWRHMGAFCSFSRWALLRLLSDSRRGNLRQHSSEDDRTVD
jgi:hypothetical protein